MSQNSQVDFGRTAQDYARHRAGFPTSFFDKLFGQNALKGKKNVLDLGTGTGTVARGFARAGFDVTGLDPSENLIGEARVLDQQAGVTTRYVQASAEATGLADHSFDIITAGQCFHWFDKEAALREIKRLLRPGGLFILAYFDWIEKPGNPVDLMKQLRDKYNPGFINKFPLGFYPQEPGELTFEGFASATSFYYEEDVPYTHIGWRGRIRAYAGVGASLPPAKVEEYDAEFAQLLAKNFKEDVMQIPHKVWAEIFQLQH